MRKHLPCGCVTAAFTVVSAVVCAADADAPSTNTVTELPPVVVTASPVTQSESVRRDGAETVSVGRAQIARLNATDLQSALRQIPGVTVSRYSPVGSYGGAQGGSVYVRGAGTARPGGEVRMYTDGAPRESGVWGHPLMDSMPIDFAEHVRVAKNPQPQTYPGTFAAVDTETRRRRTEGVEGEASAVYGRHNTVLGAASAGVKEGAFDAYAGVARKHSDGARKHGTADLESAFARTGVDLSEHERLAFIYQRTDSHVEDPGEKGGRRPVRDTFNLATDLYTLRFDTDRDTLKGYSLVYVEHGDIAWKKDHLTDGVLTSPAGDADTTWLNWGFRTAYDWTLDRLTLSGALDTASEGGHTKNTRASDGRRVFGFAGRFASVSPYLGARYDIPLGEDWTLTPSAGTRYQFHSEYDGEWTPVAALTLSRAETLDFFVNASRAAHYPGIYTRAVANDFARRTLGAEIMDYTAAGVKWHLDKSADALFTVFHTEVSDRIDKTATSYINAGSMRADGAELSAHWYPRDNLSLFAGGAYTDAETHPVSRLPEWKFSGGVSWKLTDRLRWDLDGEYIGSQYAYSVRADADRADLRKIGDGFLFNTRLALDLRALVPVDGEIFTALENFTNQHYCYYPGYPMSGIVWYTGLKIKF